MEELECRLARVILANLPKDDSFERRLDEYECRELAAAIIEMGPIAGFAVVLREAVSQEVRD